MMGYRATVLPSPAAVPPPPRPDAMEVRGISVVAHVAHRVDGAGVERAVRTGALRAVSGPDSYAGKVKAEAQLFYSAPLPAGVVMGPLPGAVGLRELQLLQSVVWLGGDQVLSVFPLVLATGATRVARAAELDGPLVTQQVLDFLNELEAASAQLVEAAEGTLRRCGVALDGRGTSSTPLDDGVGIMLWDIDGPGGPARQHAFRGVEESAARAWELSALLAHTVDHMREPDLWRRQAPQQVYAAVGSGYCFLDDHMVFTNPTCCLEVAHLPAWFRERSRFRLEQYGFDSSSLYVWTIAMLRVFALRDLTRSYGAQIADLGRRDELPPEEHGALVTTRLADEEYLSRIDGFCDFYREPRNRAYADLVDGMLRAPVLARTTGMTLTRAGSAADGLNLATIERSRSSRSLVR